MIVGRAVISNIEKVKNLLESWGSQFKSKYILKDIIFVPKKEEYNLSDDFVRVRINIRSDWPTKRVILVRKQTEFKETGKIDNLILKKEFDTEEEAFAFITKEIPEFKRGFEYERIGWEYVLDENRIFIEDIKKWKPSIEIEANSDAELQELFDKIGILETVNSSVPEIMRQII